MKVPLPAALRRRRLRTADVEVTSLGPDRLRLTVRGAQRPAGSSDVVLLRKHGREAARVPTAAAGGSRRRRARTAEIDLRRVGLDSGLYRVGVGRRRTLLQRTLLRRAAPSALKATVIDTRALVRSELGELSPPFVSAIPHRNAEGHLALRVWSLPLHAELERLEIDEGSATMTVHGRLLAPQPLPETTLVLRHRQDDAGVVRSAATVAAKGNFRAEVALSAIAAAGQEAVGYWDVYLEANGTPPVRVGRHFDDVLEKKPVFAYPVAVIEEAGDDGDSLSVRPYFTDHNNLSLAVRARTSA